MKVSKITVAATLLFSLSLFVASPEAMSRSEYWNQRVSLFELLPVEKGDIVFLGNSITDGGEFAELFDMPNIKNRGISSDVISGVKERLTQVTKNHPAKIFLLIGINDISHDKSLNRLTEEYEDLVNEIRKQSPESTLYIQSVMPINMDFKRYMKLKGKEEVIKGLNKNLKIIAEKYDAIYVDLWPSLTLKNTDKLNPSFTNDGLHLTGKGYEAWKKAISHLVNN